MCDYWNISRNTFLPTSHLPALPVCLTLLPRSPRGWGAESDWGWRSNLLLIMSCHLQTGAPTHSHRPRVREPLTCYSDWCLIMCLFITTWGRLTFSIKLFRMILLYCPTHVSTPFSLGSNLWPFNPLWSKVSTNQESKTEQKGQWTPLTVHYSALTPLVCVCQQVKSPSIGTTETHWIDSNDWFHPFPPPPLLRVCFSQRQSWNQSQSHELQDTIQMHSRLSLTSNAPGCQKAIMQQMLSKNMHCYACFVREISKWENQISRFGCWHLRFWGSFSVFLSNVCKRRKGVE